MDNLVKKLVVTKTLQATTDECFFFLHQSTKDTRGQTKTLDVMRKQPLFGRSDFFVKSIHTNYNHQKVLFEFLEYIFQFFSLIFDFE
jgi:hypothetical protein